VVRVFLAVWLAAFAIQTTDLLTLVAPDTCTEAIQGSAQDPCPEGCPRCLCCARVPAFEPQAAGEAPVEAVSRASIVPPRLPATTPSPHRVFHVPRRS
jgi:hypothetical protein